MSYCTALGTHRLLASPSHCYRLQTTLIHISTTHLWPLAGGDSFIWRHTMYTLLFTAVCLEYTTTVLCVLAHAVHRAAAALESLAQWD